MNVESAVMIKRAVQYNTAFCKKGILERLFSFWFDGFVYNQIWEDPRVDLEAMEIDSDSRILTIASGGCNLLNYLVDQPHSIQAVDLNQYHVYFTALKLAAIKYLPTYEDFFTFFGYADKDVNLDNYQQYIRSHLDEDIRDYWENTVRFHGPRVHYFTKNLYNYGKMGYFIRFLHFMSKRFARDPQELLCATDSQKREEIFRCHFEPFFNCLPIKLLGRMPFILYSLGIPPQQFHAMKIESNGKMDTIYRERLRRLICQFPIEENYFAWQALGRGYDCEKRQAVPDYLKEEHYDLIKEQVNNIFLHLSSTTDFLRNQPDRSLNRFVFLDSQDWMDQKGIVHLWEQVARTGMPGSRIIFRTASFESPVEKNLPSELRKRFHYEEKRSLELFQKDRSAIYGGFHLYTMQE